MSHVLYLLNIRLEIVSLCHARRRIADTEPRRSILEPVRFLIYFLISTAETRTHILQLTLPVLPVTRLYKNYE